MSMNFAAELPERVTDLLLSALNAEFATLSATGVPIDTPMMVFPSEGMRTFDVCTGLAYPAKAERARANPKVGLLIEGGPDDPVVSIAGMAAVHDRDIQANTDRYLRESAYARPLNPPWPLARQAVYYWSRMLVAIMPRRILWWDHPSAMDSAPHRWEAPADTRYPASDPKPAGSTSAAPKWPQQDWRDLARRALDDKLPAHLTLCDVEGFPLPIRARSAQLVGDTFVLDMPAGAPWPRTGKATLTFVGRETFVGAARATTDGVVLDIERALPINPFMADPNELWHPTEATRSALMGRLTHELARRQQPIPTLPEEEPPLTEYAQRRRARLADYFTGMPANE